MATDNFLTTKSVLGLADRVVMCPPPEIFDWGSIEWQVQGVSPQHYAQYATIRDGNTMGIANRMPANGVNICRFYEQQTGNITLAPIMKFGTNLLLGMGVTNDGRVLYIRMEQNPPGSNIFVVNIHCFGTAIQ